MSSDASVDLVSIIIPCYNAENFVGQALDSAIAQTHKNCEIIVIDDGSTDSSLAIIRRYGDLVKWETGKNRGGGAARNRGLEIANGRWVQFLDADDRMTPEKIESQLRALKGKKNMIATCPMRIFRNSEFLVPRYWVNHWEGEMSGLDLLVEMFFYEKWLHPHCWLTPMELIQKSGVWTESLAAGQDIDFFSRALCHAEGVVFVENGRTFADYRAPGVNNVSSNRSFRSCKSIFDAWNAVQGLVFSNRSDRFAKKAMLRYLRTVALLTCKHPEIVKDILRQERDIGIVDFNFNISFKRGLVFGLLGINNTLRLRRLVGVN